MFWQESILGLIPCLFLSKDNIVKAAKSQYQFSLSARNQQIILYCDDYFVCWFCEDGRETKMAFEIYPPLQLDEWQVHAFFNWAKNWQPIVCWLLCFFQFLTCFYCQNNFMMAKGKVRSGKNIGINKQSVVIFWLNQRNMASPSGGKP